jgi:23S rRNA (uracil1939-C5)-methyltransferase
MLIVFVSAAVPFPREPEIADDIRNAFPSVSGILQNINTEKTNVILGEKWHRVFGQDYLVEKLEDLLPGGKPLILKVSVSSFFQVNTAMARLLYSTALEFASDGKQTVDAAALDLYCGVGGIALALAGRFRTVLGIEESRSAIQNAQGNARVNTVSNVRFLRGGVREHLGDLGPAPIYPEGLVVVMDPPRSGCAPDVLEKIIRLSPSKIVYVSCDPGTLARDLKILKERGFAVKKVQPIDMFPQSSHIETVTLLEPCPKP